MSLKDFCFKSIPKFCVLFFVIGSSTSAEAVNTLSPNVVEPSLLKSEHIQHSFNMQLCKLEGTFVQGLLLDPSNLCEFS